MKFYCSSAKTPIDFQMITLDSDTIHKQDQKNTHTTLSIQFTHRIIMSSTGNPQTVRGMYNTMFLSHIDLSPYITGNSHSLNLNETATKYKEFKTMILQRPKVGHINSNNPYAKHAKKFVYIQPADETRTEGDNSLISNTQPQPPQQQHSQLNESSLLPYRSTSYLNNVTKDLINIHSAIASESPLNVLDKGDNGKFTTFEMERKDEMIVSNRNTIRGTESQKHFNQLQNSLNSVYRLNNEQEQQLSQSSIQEEPLLQPEESKLVFPPDYDQQRKMEVQNQVYPQSSHSNHQLHKSHQIYSDQQVRGYTSPVTQAFQAPQTFSYPQLPLSQRQQPPLMHVSYEGDSTSSSNRHHYYSSHYQLQSQQSSNVAQQQQQQQQQQLQQPLYIQNNPSYQQQPENLHSVEHNFYENPTHHNLPHHYQAMQSFSSPYSKNNFQLLNEPQGDYHVEKTQRNVSSDGPYGHAFNDKNTNNEPFPQSHLNRSKKHYLDLLVNERTQDFKVFNQVDQEVHFEFLSSLDGKFYINEKYLKCNDATDMVPIVCYRRNFNSLLMSLEFNDMPSYALMGGTYYNVSNVKISIECTSNFSSGSFDLAYFHTNSTSKESKNIINMDSSSVDLGLFKGRKKIRVKRFQFKKATPNNGKYIAKDYYYIHVNLIFELTENTGNDRTKRKLPFPQKIMSLKTCSISVRGRNPSFYTERDDISVNRDTSECFKVFLEDDA